MAQAPGLVRYACRYVRSIHDAEDAYQRAMEVALTRAPTVDPAGFIAWLHTVIRNEARSIGRQRRREAPAGARDLAESLAAEPSREQGPDAQAEWRERYGHLQDALAALTEPQRVCLLLRSAGAGHPEIAVITGYSARKVERSIVEGRARMHAFEEALALGRTCERLRPALGRVADGSAGASERRAVSRHVRHCARCRTELRHRRGWADGLAALAPVALLAPGAVPAITPDPTPVLGLWERAGGRAMVAAGSAWQHAIEVPATLGGKIGAGALAVAVAGAAGGPIVADAVRDAGRTPAIASATALTPGLPVAKPRQAPARPGAATRAPAVASTLARAARRTAEDRARPAQTTRPRPSPDPVPQADAPEPAPAPPPAPAPAPSPAPSPPPAPASSPALEFGP
jgi:RNA polymerase sigma factor (sigma-70 family)